MKDEFLKQTGLMFISMSLFNLFNLLYHFFMIRALPAVDYGHLNTLMAFFMLIIVPANTVQTTITKFVTRFQSHSQYSQLRNFLWKFFVFMLMVGSFIFLAVMVGGSVLSSFLQIPSKGLVILLGSILFLGMIAPVSNGGLQGLQQFGSLALAHLIHGGIKLAFGILFVLLGWGVLGAMGAITFSSLIATFFSFLLLWFFLKTKEEMQDLREDVNNNLTPNASETFQYFLPVGLTLLCFMVLTNIDLILVKHFFLPIEAGHYSISQMIGKIVLFLPLPVVMVMFPKVSLAEAQKKKTFPILIRSLIIAGVLCFMGVILCHVFPAFIVHQIAGKGYPECIPLIKFFSINMTFFSLTFVLLYYHLALRQRVFIYPLILLTWIQVMLIFFFHETLTQVLFMVGIVSLLLFVTIFILAYTLRKT